jgi:hypothetical protein
VYDLHEEALASYKTSIHALQNTLTEMKVPEADWPPTLKRTSGASGAQKSVSVSAFEALENALKEKQMNPGSVSLYTWPSSLFSELKLG